MLCLLLRIVEPYYIYRMSHQAIENEYNALLACHAVTGNIVKPVRGDGYKKMAKLMGMSDRDCE